MEIISVYLLLFALYLVVEISLEYLNKRHVSSFRNVPEFFRNHVSREDFRKSVSYTLRNNRFSLFSMVYQSAVLLAFVFTGFFGLTENYLENIISGRYLSGIVFIYIVFIVYSLLTLPLKIYREFVIEKEFGFSRMTPSLFVSDLAKGLAVSIALSFPLLLALFWFMGKTGGLWWVYAFLFTAFFEILVNLLYPLLIAPLFNKFQPLESGFLSEKLLKLAGDLDFSVSGIFRMDGSKRSSHSNAYFTGFGRFRRIVLFDTLLATLGDDEIEAVLAHEIGHYRKHHLLRSIALSLAVLFAAFFFLDIMLRFDSLFQAFGFAKSSYHGARVLASLYSSPLLFLLTPLFNAISRKHEYEADRFAVKAVKTKESLKNALITLGKENLSNLVPHPIYSFYHYSHPALAERIKSIENSG